MIEPPKTLMVMDLREVSLLYELTDEAANDQSLHSSDRRTAGELHEDCAALLGQEDN